MKKGYHAYININNLESILKTEEQKTDKLKKAFHQLDTYVASIENAVKRYAEIAEVEKLTASRIHIYFVGKDTDEKLQRKLFETLALSYYLADFVSTKISKYNNVADYGVAIGVDYGDFTLFNFEDEESGIEEQTSIGSPANRAAKLQSYTESGRISISNNVYDALISDIKRLFFGRSQITLEVAKKYADLTAYDCALSELHEFFNGTEYVRHCQQAGQFAYERAMSTDISEVVFSKARHKVDYSKLYLRNNKELEGIMVFADIRGFTRKFDPEGKNLPAMKVATQKILKAMHDCVIAEDGVHVQFQGDRISAFFHEYEGEEQDYIIRAYKCALSFLDAVTSLNREPDVRIALGSDKLCLGVGCANGTIYATRVGLKNNKDNIAMGETVRMADYAEDNIAGVGVEARKSEIAVTSNCYALLTVSKEPLSKKIKGCFRKRGNHYICETSLNSIIGQEMERVERNNYEEAKTATTVRPWSRDHHI